MWYKLITQKTSDLNGNNHQTIITETLGTFFTNTKILSWSRAVTFFIFKIHSDFFYLHIFSPFYFPFLFSVSTIFIYFKLEVIVISINFDCSTSLKHNLFWKQTFTQLIKYPCLKINLIYFVAFFRTNYKVLLLDKDISFISIVFSHCQYLKL